MNKEDVINNLMSSYGKYGVTREDIEKHIESGESEGFSYQTIYSGLRMAFGNITGEREHFTVAEMSEALGETEEEIINQIEAMKAELEEAGENVEDYVTEVKPEDRQRFLIMPGGLKDDK